METETVETETVEAETVERESSQSSYAEAVPVEAAPVEVATPNAAAPTPTIDGAALVRSVDAATAELDRVKHEATALVDALGQAQSRLGEYQQELADAQKSREEDAETIRRLESELWKRGDLFQDLKAQVAKLNEAIDAGAAR